MKVMNGFLVKANQSLDCDEHCYECMGDEDSLRMLVCDRCGWYCCHIYCLDPPLAQIPDEPWFCKYCLAMDRADRIMTRRRTREEPEVSESSNASNSRGNTSRNVPQRRRAPQNQPRLQDNREDSRGPARFGRVGLQRAMEDVISTVLRNMSRSPRITRGDSQRNLQGGRRNNQTRR